MNDTAISYDTPSNTQQSNTSNYSFYLLKDLSSTAKYLYIELRRLSGVRGYLSYSATDLSKIVDRSIKQTRRLLHELETHGLIEIWLHPGRESEYIVRDVYFRHGMDIKVQAFKNKSLRKKTVREQRPNGASLSIVKPEIQAEAPEITSRLNGSQTDHVQSDQGGADPCVTIESSASGQIASEPVIEPKDTHISMGNTPTRAPIRFDLICEILNLTQDTKSTRFWIKFVRSAPLPTVYLAISSLKSALAEGIVCHPGKYMTGIIRRVFPELFQNKKQPLSQPQRDLDAPIYSKPCESEPEIQPDFVLNMARLKQIQLILACKNNH
jgi:hypothetical protein